MSTQSPHLRLAKQKVQDVERPADQLLIADRERRFAVLVVDSRLEVIEIAEDLVVRVPEV